MPRGEIQDGSPLGAGARRCAWPSRRPSSGESHGEPCWFAGGKKIVRHGCARPAPRRPDRDLGGRARGCAVCVGGGRAGALLPAAVRRATAAGSGSASTSTTSTGPHVEEIVEDAWRCVAPQAADRRARRLTCDACSAVARRAGRCGDDAPSGLSVALATLGAVARATGIGSLPGTDIREALQGVRDILGDGHLPYLPELPARGPGADMIGRAAGLLVDLHVDLQPGGWRFVDRPRSRRQPRGGAAGARTSTSWPRRSTATRATSRSRCTGPWTLAAGIELNRGEKSLADRGALRDLVGLAGRGAARQHVGRGRSGSCPGPSLVLQVDEPSLPAVLAGHLPTASGYGHLRAVDPPDRDDRPARRARGATTRRAAATVVHCCDPGIPLPLLRATGVGAVALDVTALSPPRWESIAATVEDGVRCMPGACPPTAAAPSAVATDLVVRGLGRRGMSPRDLDDITATPGLRAARTHTRGGLARSTRSGRRGRGMVRTSRELTHAHEQQRRRQSPTRGGCRP